MTTTDVPSQQPACAPSHQYQHFSFHSPDAIPDVYNARLFAIREIRDYTNNLVGGILSVVDAMGLPDKQAKAIRDLIFREVWDARYQKVLEWAEREASIELREKIPVVSWKDVQSHRAMHPTPEFNPFPFSVNGGGVQTANTPE